MENLTQSLEWNSLELVEVYEFFDKPLLFTARDEAGKLSLVVLVADGDGAETWLCVPMSYYRFQVVRSGLFDLHDAFARAEGKVALVVSVPRDGLPTVQQVPCGEISEDWLPVPGERLELQTDTLASY